ncbi:hypothetical protein C0431_09035 [bacterium]|nr:hypothetical protein [bacterium]
MRFEDGFDPEWGLVLRERISAEEAREFLDRLAVSELGEADEGTVGAICEVAGVGPEVVGRMLADIRGVSWQELFGNRLDAVEKEVTGLRSKISDLERKVRDHGLVARRPQAPEEIDRIDFNTLLGESNGFEKTPFYSPSVQFSIIVLIFGACALGAAYYWIYFS